MAVTWEKKRSFWQFLASASGGFLVGDVGYVVMSGPSPISYPSGAIATAALLGSLARLLYCWRRARVMDFDYREKASFWSTMAILAALPHIALVPLQFAVKDVLGSALILAVGISLLAGQMSALAWSGICSRRAKRGA